MQAVIMVRTTGLAARLEAARREWEEMPVEVTSYKMRHRAENRYLALLLLARAAGVVS